MHVTEEDVPSMGIAIIEAAPELGRGFLIRTSRETIVRCTSLNLLILAIVVAMQPVPDLLSYDPYAASIVLLLLGILTLWPWWHFEYLAQRFKYKSYQQLQNRDKL